MLDRFIGKCSPVITHQVDIVEVLFPFGSVIKPADKDNIGKTYYNGRPTIANKCKFIKENDYAGVMIWQLFQDANDDNYDLKLINVVGREMME